MTASQKPNSYHSLPPLERGGVDARIGFEFQDHVAVGMLIEMLENADLLEVWCETHDDITLIWQEAVRQKFEFVQVKALSLNQLWSVAKLTERKRKDKNNVTGSSILERSLANDRGTEPSQFRIVTTLPPNDDLSFLEGRIGSPDRNSRLSEAADLVADLEKRIDGFVSKNGNGVRYWLEKTSWDVRQSDDSTANSNKLKLNRVSTNRGYHLFPDQLDEVYAAFLALARSAAVAVWGNAPDEKKISKTKLENWLDSQLMTRLHPAPTAGTKLENKLQRAGITQGDITACFESRQQYLAERYSPKYLTHSDIQLVEGEVGARLHTLRAQLDAGILEDDGHKFHYECLTAMDQLQEQLPDTPLAILQGCMYNITDRCVHRFRRPTA